MRATTAFSRLLRLPGIWVRQVSSEADRVAVTVALRRWRPVCPDCDYTTRSRHDTRPVDSAWRHLDLGVWRLEVRAPTDEPQSCREPPNYQARPPHRA